MSTNDDINIVSLEDDLITFIFSSSEVIDKDETDTISRVSLLIYTLPLGYQLNAKFYFNSCVKVIDVLASRPHDYLRSLFKSYRETYRRDVHDVIKAIVGHDEFRRIFEELGNP